MSSKKIHINDIVIIFVMGIVGITMLIEKDHFGQAYFNNLTNIILVLFSLSIIIIMRLERNNPFITIISINVSLFYLLRIQTLLLTKGYNTEMGLIHVPTLEEYNSALVFICLAYLALVAGLRTRRSRLLFEVVSSKSDNTQMNHTIIVYLAMLAIIALTYDLSARVLGVQIILSNIVMRLFSVDNIMIFIIGYLSYQYFSEGKLSKILVAIVFATFFYRTFIGSRAFVMVQGNVLLASLLVLNKYHIRIKTLLIAMVSSLLSILLFEIATYSRWVLRDDVSIDISSYYYNIVHRFSMYDNAFIFNSLFDRIGYLDRAVNSMVNADAYKEIFNITYYFKSIIDSISPGYEIFGTPLSGQGKSFIVRFNYTPSFNELTSESYYSILTTIYGEYYILFGYIGSIALLFITAKLFITYYRRVKIDSTNINYFMKQLIILLLFQWMLDSFGIDWVIVRLLQVMLIYYSLYWYSRIRYSN
jgi:hypothetical protein